MTTFRDAAQKNLAIRTLLRTADLDRYWTDMGPGHFGAIQPGSPAGRMLETAQDFWDDSIRVWVMGMRPRDAVTAGRLLCAVAEGHDAIDRWIFRNESPDRGEQLTKLRAVRPDEWRDIVRRAGVLCAGDPNDMADALGVSERTVVRWLGSDEDLRGGR
jgi:hypothetical protein